MKKFKILDMKFIVIISTILGAFGWLFTFFYNLIKPYLNLFALKKLKITEIMFIAIISTALGVFWWGYTFFYDIFKPFLKPFALENLLSGIWLMGAVFIPYIIRKPGSALLGEMIAAFVQGFIARWGIISIIWGFGQALPVEIFFLLLRYKKWKLIHLVIAGLLSAISSFFLSFFWEKWYLLEFRYIIAQFSSFVITGAVLTSFLSYWLANRLKATGVLNQFLIMKDSFDN